MIERRFYPKGYKGKTYSEEYLKKLQEKGVRTELVDNARREILLSRAEQKEAFERCCEMVLQNPRWVLDNLDHLPEFRVKQKYIFDKKPKSI